MQGPTPPTKGPVLLAHGAGVRANLFRAPVETTIVDHLIDCGYDVWLENWRATIDLKPNTWNLDKAAVFDHPRAVKKVVEETGSDKIKAVIHCQGSTSFMMSAVAGLVPAGDNHRQQRGLAASRRAGVQPLQDHQTAAAAQGADRLPQSAVGPPRAYVRLPKIVAAMVEFAHHECNNPVCKGVSFTYGTGFPALWSHENLNDATHEWIKQEFAQCPITFFEQMATLH